MCTLRQSELYSDCREKERITDVMSKYKPVCSNCLHAGTVLWIWPAWRLNATLLFAGLSITLSSARCSERTLWSHWSGLSPSSPPSQMSSSSSSSSPSLSSRRTSSVTPPLCTTHRTMRHKVWSSRWHVHFLRLWLSLNDWWIKSTWILSLRSSCFLLSSSLWSSPTWRSSVLLGQFLLLTRPLLKMLTTLSCCMESSSSSACCHTFLPSSTSF